MSFLKTLTQRNLIHNHTDASALEAHLSRKPTFYCGFDPTADSLHIGSLLPLLTMKRLVNAGCTPIAIVGGATALIGDPSGRKQQRTMLTPEQISLNTIGISKQIQSVVGPQCVLLNNLDWHKGRTFIDFLRDTGKYFPINKLLALDSVKSRIEAGLSFTEFSYSLLQAEDFSHLAQNYNCTLQIGGSDQWGNMSMGTELIRKRSGQETHLLTFPLLTQANGEKFGKTASGTIWLDPTKTEPKEFYNYFLSTADADVGNLLRMLTEIPLEDIDRLLQMDPSERIPQKQLAQSLLKLVHPTVSLDLNVQTLAYDRNQFASLSIEQLKQLPVKEVAIELSTQPKLVDVLVSTGISPSRTQARRDVDGRGIYLNGQMVSDSNRILTTQDLMHQQGLLLTKGRLHTVRIVPSPKPSLDV